LTLRFLLGSTRHYFEDLKVIKQLTRELQTKLNTSLENQYLLQMFALAESLTYYLNAIEANAAVLSRLRAHSETIGFSERELEILDDLSIEHQQCYKQTEITSSVLSTLMDARGTLVNNNMNVLLKNLTIINVIFLPLNLLASILGMSEFTDMTRSVDWRVSYSLLIVAMGALGWLTWRYLVRRIDRWVARAGG
jgi:magnesium transporter